MFSSVKSTTRLGLPSALVVVTMRLHQSTGVLTGTRSMTPSCSSLSRPALTADFQCSGTVLGVWTALGVTFSDVKILRGGEDSISLRGCFSQQLKALLAYLLRIYCLRMGRFSGVGGQGSTGGLVGGDSRLGHEQPSSSCVGTPEFEHLVGLMLLTMA